MKTLRRNRGLTILELLVAAGIGAMIVGAISSTYLSGMNFTARVQTDRDRAVSQVEFEDRMRSFLQEAWLSPTATDTTCYFIGGTPSTQTAGLNATQQATSSQGLSNGVANELTFTINGRRLPYSVVTEDSSIDFPTANQNLGPQGGTQEIAFELTPVGSPPDANSKGLFLRVQDPADDDPTQGGNESVFNSQVTQITFQFYDGANWQPSWDTTTASRRLPAAVWVDYQLNGDTDTDYQFIVALPNSDVTPTNPVTDQGGSTQTTTP
jgi:hypothetical protein